MNITPLAEASAPEAQVGEIVPAPSVISTIDAPPTEASALPTIVSADAIPVEITETVTVVVPGQKPEDDEAAAIGIAGIEPSVTEESSQTAAHESEAKATELSEPTGTAEAQIEFAEPAPTEVEPPSTDVNALPTIVSADAVLVEITETVTVVVPGQRSEDDEGAAVAASGIAGRAQ